jgi:hypothetical protein
MALDLKPKFHGFDLLIKSATIGWYYVYLFDSKGEGVYLTHSHGTTS